MKMLIVLLALTSLCSCAQLLKLQGQTAEKAAQAIEAYCKNTDATFRANFKAEVNAKSAPNSVDITCAQ